MKNFREMLLETSSTVVESDDIRRVVVDHVRKSLGKKGSIELETTYIDNRIKWKIGLCFYETESSSYKPTKEQKTKGIKDASKAFEKLKKSLEKMLNKKVNLIVDESGVWWNKFDHQPYPTGWYATASLYT